MWHRHNICLCGLLYSGVAVLCILYSVSKIAISKLFCCSCCLVWHFTVTLQQGWASEWPDVKNYKWRLNPVWHRMLYSCTHMATEGVKGLRRQNVHECRSQIQKARSNHLNVSVSPSESFLLKMAFENHLRKETFRCVIVLKLLTLYKADGRLFQAAGPVK